jgi:hypothetical protein
MGKILDLASMDPSSKTPAHVGICPCRKKFDNHLKAKTMEGVATALKRIRS